MTKNLRNILSRCLVLEFPFTDINDINHGYRAAILKKNSLLLLPFYMLWLLISVMKRCAERCALQLRQTSLVCNKHCQKEILQNLLFFSKKRTYVFSVIHFFPFSYFPFRSSHRRCSKKFRPEVCTTLLKKRLWYGCFRVNLAKFLKPPFFTEPLGNCFYTLPFLGVKFFLDKLMYKLIRCSIFAHIFCS